MRISTEREIEARVKVMSQGEAGVNSRSEWIRMRGGGSKVKNTKTGVKGLGMWGGPKQKVRGHKGVVLTKYNVFKLELWA